jgi:hypothetical protein
LIVNAVEYESDPGSPPPGFPADHTSAIIPGANPGDTFIDGIWTPKEPTS